MSLTVGTSLGECARGRPFLGRMPGRWLDCEITPGASMGNADSGIDSSLAGKRTVSAQLHGCNRHHRGYRLRPGTRWPATGKWCPRKGTPRAYCSASWLRLGDLDPGATESFGHRASGPAPGHATNPPTTNRSNLEPERDWSVVLAGAALPDVEAILTPGKTAVVEHLLASVAGDVTSFS